MEIEIKKNKVAIEFGLLRIWFLLIPSRLRGHVCAQEAMAREYDTRLFQYWRCPMWHAIFLYIVNR